MLNWLAQSTIPVDGWVAGWLDQLGIMQTQLSFAGVGADLGKKMFFENAISEPSVPSSPPPSPTISRKLLYVTAIA